MCYTKHSSEIVELKAPVRPRRRQYTPVVRAVRGCACSVIEDASLRTASAAVVVIHDSLLLDHPCVARCRPAANCLSVIRPGVGEVRRTPDRGQRRRRRTSP
jgi:hypothetical protein